jgi:hypothetical protein
VEQIILIRTPVTVLIIVEFEMWDAALAALRTPLWTRDG